MKSFPLWLVSAVVAFLLSACAKDSTNPYGANNGQYMFWVRSNLGIGHIDMALDNQPVGTITHYYDNGVDCGKADVNVTKPAGTYSWSAKAQNGTTWGGTVTVEEGKCNQQELAGGGTGGGGTTCASTRALVSVVSTVRGTVCGNTNSLTVVLRNNSNQDLAMTLQLQRANGTWDCGTNGSVAPGATWSYYTCTPTGTYRYDAMLASDWLRSSCHFVCP